MDDENRTAYDELRELIDQTINEMELSDSDRYDLRKVVEYMGTKIDDLDRRVSALEDNCLDMRLD